jgi:hypothetical protein
MFSNLILLCLLTFATSSIWLYSPGLIQSFREWWIKYFSTNKITKIRFLQYLAICQLCSGFWFGILNYLYLFNDISFKSIIVAALIAAGFSWLLGTFTNALLWIVAFLEASYNANYEDKK